MRRLAVLLMAVALFATGAVAPAIAKDDNGKRFVEGAFHSLGTGGATLEFGPAGPAGPQAEDNWNSVRIFGYTEFGEGPSKDQVYCDDVWNVIVTVNVAPFRDWFVDVFATQSIDGDPHFVVENKTPVRQNGAVGILTQAYGTFLPPGTLGDGKHTIEQTLQHPVFGDLWTPDPVTIYVDDSAC